MIRRSALAVLATLTTSRRSRCGPRGPQYGTVARDAIPGNTSGSTVGDLPWENGVRGVAAQLDGVNDWVDVPDFSINSDFTIAFWVNLAAGISNQDAVVGRVGAGQDINFYAGKLRLFNGSSDVVIASSLASAGVWTRCAIVRSGSTVRLYVNGSLQSTGTWSGSFAPPAIGRGSAGFFGGTIDDLRIYTRALPTSEL